MNQDTVLLFTLLYGIPISYSIGIVIEQINTTEGQIKLHKPVCLYERKKSIPQKWGLSKMDDKASWNYKIFLQ